MAGGDDGTMRFTVKELITSVCDVCDVIVKGTDKEFEIIYSVEGRASELKHTDDARAMLDRFIISMDVVDSRLVIWTDPK